MSFSGGTEKHLDRLWAVGLVAAVLLGIAVLEIAHPYFFFQDDNRGQNLPLYVHNLRSLLGGEVPLFNFHQFVGTPSLACVQSAPLYPPNYTALLASQGVFGHPFAAIDIVVAFHLIVAALGFFSLARGLGFLPVGAAFGAVTWTFNGFVIVASSSWAQVAGAAAALPWTIHFALRLRRDPGAGGAILLAGARTLFFLQGHPQFFVFGTLFEIGIATSTLFPRKGSESDRTLGRFLALYTLSILLTAALSMPILLPAAKQVEASIQRGAGMTWEAFALFSLPVRDWFIGLADPVGIFTGRDSEWFHGRTLSHVGPLTVVFALLVACGWRAMPCVARRTVGAFSLLGLLWLFFACDLGVTWLAWQVPGFDRFRWPFKGVFLTNFAFATVAAFGFDAFERRWAVVRSRVGTPSIRRFLVPILLILHFAGLLFVHTTSPQKMFGVQRDRPPFEEPLKGMLAEGRVATVGFNEVSSSKDLGYFVPTLGQNYATLFGLNHFGGYEILLLRRNSDVALGLNLKSNIMLPDKTLSLDTVRETFPFAHLRRWGVRWYVISNDIRLTDLNGDVQPVFRDEQRTILRDERVFPMVFWNDPPGTSGLAHEMRGNTVRIVVADGPGGVLVVNVLHHPNFKATVDGRPVPLRESAVGQIEVDAPPGDREIRVVYTEPLFDLGLAVAGGAIAFAASLLWVERRRRCGLSPNRL